MKYFVLITDRTALAANAEGSTDTPFFSRLATSSKIGTVRLDEKERDLSLMGMLSTPSDPAKEPLEEDSEVTPEDTPEEASQEMSEETSNEASEEVSEETTADALSPFFAKWQTEACCFSDSKAVAETLTAVGFDAHHLVIKTPLSSTGVPLDAAIRAAYASGHTLAYFHLTETLAESDGEARQYLDEELAASLGDSLEEDGIRILLIASGKDGACDLPYLIYTPKTSDAFSTEAEAGTETETESEITAESETDGEETPTPSDEAPSLPDAHFTYEASASGNCVMSGKVLFAALLGIQLPEEAKAAPSVPSETPEKKPPRAHAVFEWLELFVLSLCAVLILMTLVVRHSPVSGDSMYPTLHNGDVLVISRIDYTPKNGDIVIIQTPEDDVRRPLVKRIIAVGGQTVRINFETWEVFIDGKLVQEDYVNRKLNVMEPYYISLYFDKVDEIHEIYESVVPENHVFVMGDNRNNSKDSRVLGFIDERYIIGDVKFRLSPLSSIGAVD